MEELGSRTAGRARRAWSMNLPAWLTSAAEYCAEWGLDEAAALTARTGLIFTSDGEPGLAGLEFRSVAVAGFHARD